MTHESATETIDVDGRVSFTLSDSTVLTGKVLGFNHETAFVRVGTAIYAPLTSELVAL